MARHHVPPAIAVESHDDLDLFSLTYGNRVLRSLFPGHWRGSVSLQNLEIYQMNMDWMQATVQPFMNKQIGYVFQRRHIVTFRGVQGELGWLDIC